MRLSTYRWVAVACLVLTGWGSSPTRLLWFGVPCCRAQEQEQEQESEATKKAREVFLEESKSFIGGGGFVKTMAYAEVKPTIYPAPMIADEGERLYVRSAQRGVSDHQEPGGDRLDRWCSRVSRAIVGATARFSTACRAGIGRSTAGSILEAATPVGLFGVSAVTDLLGRYRGQEVE